MDNVAIKITKEFYKEVLSGEEICTAHDLAIKHTQFALASKINQCKSEVERVKLLRRQGPDGCMGLYSCNTLPVAEKGKW